MTTGDPKIALGTSETNLGSNKRDVFNNTYAFDFNEVRGFEKPHHQT
jgi:hypothetical protein